MLLCCLHLSEQSLPPNFESICLFQSNLTQSRYIEDNQVFPSFMTVGICPAKSILQMPKLKEILQCNLSCYTLENLHWRCFNQWLKCREAYLTRTGVFLSGQVNQSWHINPWSITVCYTRQCSKNDLAIFNENCNSPSSTFPFVPSIIGGIQVEGKCHSRSLTYSKLTWGTWPAVLENWI